MTDPAAPARLGAYPLLEVIGEGSMGTLYRSIDRDTGRRVALKTVRRDRLDPGDAENLTLRLRIEAEAAGRLSHPGIVAVYEYGEDAGFAYIAMEYVEGRSLRERLGPGTRFAPASAVGILTQLLDALGHAHGRGVWHRDVKPANILMTQDNRVKLTDFGIARIGSSPEARLDAVMGTPGYIAPETYLSDAFDHRIDIFAAGAVLYQLLTGTPAFAGTAQEVMFKVCYEKPPAPSLAADSPSLTPLDAVVLRALARRPQDRFASAAGFRKALLEALAALPAE